MFAIGIEYLSGTVRATHPSDHTRPEWPPHPDRVFSALAAAHFETGAGEAERKALLWFEALQPPGVLASSHAERSLVTAYVPVNDVAMPRIRSDKTPSAAQVRAGLALLPERRPRQARHFPVAIPEHARVLLVWPEAEADRELTATLGRLCSKVTRVGHSSSLVRMWIDEHTPTAASADGLRMLIPISDRTTRYRLRITAPGRLDDLARSFAASLRPSASLWHGYDEEAPPLVQTSSGGACFHSDLVVLRRVAGHHLDLAATLPAARALRNAILKRCPDPPPEWVSGHNPDGRPSEQDHVALFPLPHVGHEHAGGHLLGFAIAVPRPVEPRERFRCFRDLLYDDLGAPRRLETSVGRHHRWTLEVDDGAGGSRALRPEVWTAAGSTGGAVGWATVTPIALDRHPKRSRRWQDVEQTIRRACVRLGLPEPAEVYPTSVSPFAGTPTAGEFPCLRRKSDGSNVQHTHAILMFEEPVTGPVVLGAGRYRGYGLCRPLTRERHR